MHLNLIIGTLSSLHSCKHCLRIRPRNIFENFEKLAEALMEWGEFEFFFDTNWNSIACLQILDRYPCLDILHRKFNARHFRYSRSPDPTATLRLMHTYYETMKLLS